MKEITTVTRVSRLKFTHIFLPTLWVRIGQDVQEL
jgi:hypothetical protein